MKTMEIMIKVATNDIDRNTMIIMVIRWINIYHNCLESSSLNDTLIVINATDTFKM